MFKRTGGNEVIGRTLPHSRRLQRSNLVKGTRFNKIFFFHETFNVITYFNHGGRKCFNLHNTSRSKFRLSFRHSFWEIPETSTQPASQRSASTARDHRTQTLLEIIPSVVRTYVRIHNLHVLYIICMHALRA